MDKDNAPHTVKRPIDKRAALLTAVAAVAALAASFGGILSQNALAAFSEDLLGFLCLAALLFPLVCLLANIIARRIYIKKINSRSVAETQQYFVSHRDDPEKTAAQKLRFLKTLIRINDSYSILLTLCALVCAFLLGTSGSVSENFSILWICWIVLSGTASRIRFKRPETFFKTDKTYVSENDYPALYTLAKKAAAATGCTEKIKIAILDDFNAGTAKINSTVSIQLGALLLNILSEDEVYSILLHEFSHIKDEAGRETITNYNLHICDIQNGSIANIFSFITKHLYSFADTYFAFQYSLYSYTVSILRENAADKAMAMYCSSEIAASALVKTKYYELFDWEKGTYDTPCHLEPEEYDTGTLKKDAQSFKDAMQRSIPKWNALIDNEILSRSATHPTLKMRLATLGVSEPKALQAESSAEYLAECEKAIAYAGSLIAEQSGDSYREYRSRHYIGAKETVERWESGGRNIIAEEYGDVCDALRLLGRNTEVLALCENAIEVLDDTAACYAHFMKGCFLLHSFDETGIDCIYKAIEINRNYVDEGLDVIGQFCCLTGQEDQLEIYREQAVILTEESQIHNEANTLNKKDRLSAESLPGNMLEDILAHITAAHSDSIEKIFLVRKTVTDDFFTSVFVIKTVSGTDDDTRNKILHKAFCYLDTCSDWQFSLFDYDDVSNVKFENIAGSCVYSK